MFFLCYLYLVLQNFLRFEFFVAEDRLVSLNDFIEQHIVFVCIRFFLIVIQDLHLRNIVIKTVVTLSNSLKEAVSIPHDSA